MRNSIYKHIRLGVIILCLVLIAAALVPAVALAAEMTPAEQDSVHFINPTAITVVGDRLYVADKIEDSKTAIICFDASSDSPEPLSTYEFDMVVNGLANNNDDVIYAMGQSSVTELKVDVNRSITIGETYNSFAEDVNIVDFAYGNIPYSTTNKTLYALTQNSILQYLGGKFQTFANLSSLKDTAGLLSFSNSENTYLYYLHDGTCDRYNLNTNGQDEDFTKKLVLTSGFTPTGMFALADKVGLYNNTEIYEIEESTLHADTVAKLSLAQKYGADCSIIDVEARGERLFVLNSKNQIDVFDKVDNAYDTENYTTIGSDMVDKAVPAAYTSFTLVRPNGYPANIVYKTNADSSVSDIITDAKEYVILGYDGEENSHYYYVLVGDKFGWVKKSDNAELPAEDNKLTIVDNNVDNDTMGAQVKFTSLNAVYIYNLPRENAEQIKITQTASTMMTVQVLQRYQEGDTVWYYVRYDENKTGFVKKSDVGQLHYVSKVEKVDVIGSKKINSSLFAPVDLYATAELTENDLVADAQGNTIKLYSGDRVTLIRTEGDSAFIMILHSNGEKDFGWIEANRLIDRHAMTTNSIVGLSLLAVAIALTTILLVVYFKRKKRIRANKD